MTHFPTGLHFDVLDLVEEFFVVFTSVGGGLNKVLLSAAVKSLNDLAYLIYVSFRLDSAYWLFTTVFSSSQCDHQLLFMDYLFILLVLFPTLFCLFKSISRKPCLAFFVESVPPFAVFHAIFLCVIHYVTSHLFHLWYPCKKWSIHWKHLIKDHLDEMCHHVSMSLCLCVITVSLCHHVCVLPCLCHHVYVTPFLCQCVYVPPYLYVTCLCVTVFVCVYYMILTL